MLAAPIWVFFNKDNIGSALVWETPFDPICPVSASIGFIVLLVAANANQLQGDIIMLGYLMSPSSTLFVQYYIFGLSLVEQFLYEESTNLEDSKP